MSDYLDEVEEQLAAGVVSAQSLVLVFRVAEEAEQQRDTRELERALELAKRIARAVSDPLEAEAQRLIALCAERLERARGARETSSGVNRRLGLSRLWPANRSERGSLPRLRNAPRLAPLHRQPANRKPLAPESHTDHPPAADRVAETGRGDGQRLA